MAAMKIESVNVGLPRTVEWQGREMTTAIFKEPVAGRVAVGRLNLAGDRQADLQVHGGIHKAVYVYPSEHYSFWQSELPDTELPWGMFGENLTSSGILEEEVNVGDRFRIGSAEFAATEPRVPCSKLAMRFGRKDILKRFLDSRRTGFYMRVLEEGELRQGDGMERIGRNEDSIAIPDIMRLYLKETEDSSLLERAADLDGLSESWRNYFRNRLEKVS